MSHSRLLYAGIQCGYVKIKIEKENAGIQIKIEAYRSTWSYRNMLFRLNLEQVRKFFYNQFFTDIFFLSRLLSLILFIPPRFSFHWKIRKKIMHYILIMTHFTLYSLYFGPSPNLQTIFIK